MNAKELFDLAPLGARVRYSDGTPRPPDRFKNKLYAWKGKNGVGYFMHADPGSGREHDHPRFTIQNAPAEGLITVVTNRLFTPDSNLSFEVELPAPGTILAHGGLTPRGTVEIRYVWPDLAAAQSWAVKKRYVLNNCGLRFYRVADDGSLVDFDPEGK